MRLFIVTINYNGSESTIRLLKSLQNQTDQNFQTIVIDNASDEVDFKILSSFVNVSTSQVDTLVTSRKNLGFSGGNNVGIKKALDPPAGGGADWVLLLNNDIWVKPSFIASLKAKLTALEGSQGESRSNGRSRSEGVVGIPLNEGDHTAYCGKIEWLKSSLKHIYVSTSQIDTSHYIIGGALVVHRSVFEKIGFLDEKYFLYFEDADLSIRAQKAGLKLTFLEEPSVHHQVSSTTKKLGSPLLLRYHYRNALYFNLKNGPWYIKILVWPWSWIILIKQALKIMIYHNTEDSRAILKGVFDFYLNKMSKI